MNIVLKSVLIGTLLLVTSVYAYAQEVETTTTTTTQETVEVTEVTEVTGDVSVETEGETTDVVMEETVEGELSEEELSVLLEGLEIVDAEDVADFEGEVIAVTDDIVVIKTEYDTVIIVSTESYQERTSSGSDREIKVGETVVSGTIGTSGDTRTLTTKTSTYTLLDTVSITKDGKKIALEDIEDGEEMTAVFDSNGELVAIEISEGTEKESKAALFAGIIAVLLIILLAMMSRKKETVA